MVQLSSATMDFALCGEHNNATPTGTRHQNYFSFFERCLIAPRNGFVGLRLPAWVTPSVSQSNCPLKPALPLVTTDQLALYTTYILHRHTQGTWWWYNCVGHQTTHWSCCAAGIAQIFLCFIFHLTVRIVKCRLSQRGCRLHLEALLFFF